ncbi:MAG: four helix bundle protein [Planctomycetaceae bacterium]|nr:four helix bundle protein [Planctomycetaceae bacterium]
MTRIRKSGGYRQLASFQTTTLIYDATVWFCEKFVDRFSRTGDQMVQAARSGRQNIAEGSRAGATSSQTELRLINVARASLEELLLDFEDYLRHRRLKLWDSNGPEAKAVRQVAWGKKTDRSDRTDHDRSDPADRSDLTKLTDEQRWELYSQWLDHADPAVRSNAVICLIHQANYLLDQQLDALEAQFINGGGYSEQLATARLTKRAGDRRQAPVSAFHATPTYRSTQPVELQARGSGSGSAIEPPLRRESGSVGSSTPKSYGLGIRCSTTAAHRDVRSVAATEKPPVCPRCDGLMTLRTAKTGRHAGSQFWGCVEYPNCQGTAEV